MHLLYNKRHFFEQISWIKTMQDRVDDRYRDKLLFILTDIQTLVATRADNTADLNQRFYMDALTDLLDKTCKHIPKLFTTLRSFQKESLVYALVENYELIHLNHERRFNYATGLSKDAPITAGAIAQFYRQNASRREQAGCQHAVFLYNDRLYHYDCGIPNAPPALTEITLDYNYAPLELDPAQLEEAKKIRLDAYRKLKAQSKSLPQDRIHWATSDAREWMETLGVSGVTKDYMLRHANINLLAGFLPGIIVLLADAEREWRDAKKMAVGQSAQGAFLLITGIVVQTAMAGFSRSLLSMPVILANMMIVMKFVLILGTLFLAASLGFALYCYVQENIYHRMAMDLAQVNYAKEYPSPQGIFNPDVRYEVNKPLATFFQDHRPELDPVFPPPLPNAR